MTVYLKNMLKTSTEAALRRSQNVYKWVKENPRKSIELAALVALTGAQVYFIYLEVMKNYCRKILGEDNLQCTLLANNCLTPVCPYALLRRFKLENIPKFRQFCAELPQLQADWKDYCISIL